MTRSNVLLNVVLFLGLVSIGAEVLCEMKGSCKECTGKDSFREYCKETSRMANYICNDGDRQYEELRSCSVSAEVRATK
jgi:hypothetical protein